jgi:hypothetical protein
LYCSATLHEDVLENFWKAADFPQNSGFSKVSAFPGNMLGDAQFQEQFTTAIFQLSPFFLDTLFAAVVDGGP